MSELNAAQILRATLSKDAFWMVNKKIAALVGHAAAILIADLISREAYFSGRNMLTHDGYFFAEVEQLEAQIGFKGKARRTAMQKLVNAGFLLTKRRGIPRRHYYKIDHESIISALSIDAPETTYGDTPETTQVDAPRAISLNKNKAIRTDNKNNTNNDDLAIEVLIQPKMMSSGTSFKYAPSLYQALNEYSKNTGQVVSASQVETFIQRLKGEFTIEQVISAIVNYSKIKLERNSKYSHSIAFLKDPAKVAKYASMSIAETIEPPRPVENEAYNNEFVALTPEGEIMPPPEVIAALKIKHNYQSQP